MKTITNTILALILACAGINAQEMNVLDDKNLVVIELISGTVIEGTINEWVIDEHIDIKTVWTESIVLPAKVIKKVVQKSALTVMAKQHYRFRETGLYYSAKLQFISGNEGARARSINGFGTSFSLGHRFNRLVCVGGGIGYDKFVWNTGENFLPLFLEYTSYLAPKNTTLYTNIQTGYSLAFKDESNLLVDAKGGWMFYPSIGLRIGSGDNKFTMDLGYKFQQATLTYGDSWTRSTSEQRLTYKRLTFRIGILM